MNKAEAVALLCGGEAGIEEWNRQRRLGECCLDLSGVNLRGVNLSGVNLSGVNLSGVNLIGADLREADLSGADLREANLRLVAFCGATIDGAVLSKDDVGGPGHILCALTSQEWELIQEKRA